MPSSFANIRKPLLLYECPEFAPQSIDLMRQTAHTFTLNTIQDQLKTEMSIIRPIPKLNHSHPTYLGPFQKLQMSQSHTDDMFQSHALAAAAAAAVTTSSKIPTAIPVSRESAFTPIPQKNSLTPNSTATSAAVMANFCFNNCQTCLPRSAGGLSEIHRLPPYLDNLLMQSCEPFLGGHRNGLLAAAAAAAAVAVDPSASCFAYGLTEQCLTISPHLPNHLPKLSTQIKDEDAKLSLTNALMSAQFRHRYQPTSLSLAKSPSSVAVAGLAGQTPSSWTENNILSFLNLHPPVISSSGSGGRSGITVSRNGTGQPAIGNQANAAATAAAAAILAKEFRQTTNHPPRYQCEACKKSYATFGGLSKHKQFHCVTQVKREFSCKFCSKSYASLGALKMHIRTHTLPCRCKLCGKAFSRPWLLQGHIRTHTGEKPFKCPHCGRAFADRSNLRAHLQTHSDVKKYGCKTCNKTFSRMSLLLKHEDSSCPGIRC